MYEIKKGDTLTKIARETGLTIKQIMRANPKIMDPDKIMAGDSLQIPNHRHHSKSIGFNKVARRMSPRYLFNEASSNLGTGTNILPRNINNIASRIDIFNYTAKDYENLVNHMKSREGYQLEIYKDADGYSFGIGHRLTGKDRERIENTPMAERTQLAAKFFEKDIARSLSAAIKQLKHLPPHAQTPDMLNALTGVNFQLGTNWHKIHKNTWELMTQGKLDIAAIEITDSQWNQQTPLRVQDMQTALITANLNKSNTLYAATSTLSTPVA